MSLIELEKSDKILTIAVVYTKKDDGRFKSRACVLGNLQQIGKDVEIFSPVVSASVVKMAFSWATHHKLHMCQADISNAFADASIPDERRIFVRYPSKCGGGIYNCTPLLTV